MRLKIKKQFLLPAAGLVGFLVVLSAGCGRSPDGTGEPLPVSDQIGKARVFARRGDYRQAVEMYHKALELEPDNADAYLQLGIIYDDNLKDKNLAAAYYREFLRRDPDSEKAGRVRQWLAKTLAAVPDEPVSPPEPMSSPVPAAPVGASPPPLPRPRSTPVPGIRPAAGTAPGSYTVRGGDTLAGIARELYGDSNAWNRIYRANRDQLENPHALKVGQILTIPR